MTTTTIEIENKTSGKLLEPNVEVLMGASGITDEQARICVLYALCTHRDDLERMPILPIMGMTGTGKSWLLDQMLFLVKDPKIATATTYATMRDEMVGCRTYIIDEADKVSERLLLARSEKNLSVLSHKVGTGHGWENAKSNVFGATILARRNPFKDSAIRNRCVVIHTKYNRGEYEVKYASGLDSIAQDMKIVTLGLGSGRVQDTWTPLLEIAKSTDDSRYEEAIQKVIQAEKMIFRSGQQYEAEDVVLHALDKLTWDRVTDTRVDTDLELSDVTKTACEIGDVKLVNKQVEEVLLSKGFSVTYTHGVKLVRSNTKLMESLL